MPEPEAGLEAEVEAGPLLTKAESKDKSAEASDPGR